MVVLHAPLADNGTVSTQKIPYWIRETTRDFEPLTQDLDTDVLVIGAGLCGLLTALNLAKLGRRVTVLEARQPGHVKQ